MGEHEMTALILQNIRDAISASGLKQKAVAVRAGLSEAQLSDLLCGRKVLRADIVPRIAAAVGVSVDRLYQEKDMAV